MNKAHPTPRAPAKMPKGRVMLIEHIGMLVESSGPNHGQTDLADQELFYVAVIPCRTRKEARAVVRLHSMTPTERIERLAHGIYCAKNPAPHVPRPSFKKWLTMWHGEKEDYAYNTWRSMAIGALKALNLPTP